VCVCERVCVGGCVWVGMWVCGRVGVCVAPPSPDPRWPPACPRSPRPSLLHGLGFVDWGVWFKVYGLELRVHVLGLMVYGVWFPVDGLRFGVQDLGLGV